MCVCVPVSSSPVPAVWPCWRPAAPSSSAPAPPAQPAASFGSPGVSVEPRGAAPAGRHAADSSRSEWLQRDGGPRNQEGKDSLIMPPSGHIFADSFAVFDHFSTLKCQLRLKRLIHDSNEGLSEKVTKAALVLTLDPLLLLLLFRRANFEAFLCRSDDEEAFLSLLIWQRLEGGGFAGIIQTCDVNHGKTTIDQQKFEFV